MNKLMPLLMVGFLGCTLILALLGFVIQASANAIQATANAAQSTANLVTQCTNGLMVLIALLGGSSFGILLGLKRSLRLPLPQPETYRKPGNIVHLPELQSPTVLPIIPSKAIHQNDADDAFSLNEWGW
jgi:hypothetical protein